MLEVGGADARAGLHHELAAVAGAGVVAAVAVVGEVRVAEATGGAVRVAEEATAAAAAAAAVHQWRVHE